MPPINWRALRVSSNTRWAIYNETFPAQLEAALAAYPEALEAFDQDAAVDVLLAVAGAWPTLARDRDDEAVRYYLRVYPARDPVVVATFVAVELSDQQIVVAAVEVEPI
ncbi:MAG: hypothetical protein OES24_12460 [Acidimicrobiia bacterium]|nr:hypothetical protein [Acidimicrobiia bacterium]